MQKKSTEQRARLLLDNIICEEKIAPLLNLIQKENSATFVHSMNVAFIAVQMGIDRGFKKARLENMARGALLHDIGKVDIDSSVLEKKSVLTNEEYDAIKMHPVLGYEKVKNMKFPEIVLDIIRHHHEKLDGSGYPDGLAMAQISVETQIVTVADVWDAMTSERPYKTEYAGNIALSELKDYENTFYDKEAIRLLTMCHDK